MIQHHPILIRKISHLTDARYFAAMGIDWMSIELNADPATFSLWHTLRDWISGIQLAADISDGDEMLYSKVIIDARPDGIIADSLDFVHLTGGMEMFLSSEEITMAFSQNDIKLIAPYRQGITDITSFLSIPSNAIFLESDWTFNGIDLLKQKGYKGGFCLKGTPESQTGIKDYSFFDEILERINP
ncbi:MAG: hypothetical protein M3R25_08645 [Bacteroidota bacterium]|nr:hypothetical protein [Bacteroidota bacterium]